MKPGFLDATKQADLVVNNVLVGESLPKIEVRFAFLNALLANFGQQTLLRPKNFWAPEFFWTSKSFRLKNSLEPMNPIGSIFGKLTPFGPINNFSSLTLSVLKLNGTNAPGLAPTML